MDRKLLDLLACPTTRQPLRPIDPRALDGLNAAIAAGGVKRSDGSPQSAPVDAALVTADGRLAYRVDDGIPVLLANEAIDLTAAGVGAT
ncbi:Trm112 family protein [Cognatilysobacter lacus]|uniref:Trm112 family protein n=1 Tax=Cognatilysobacter lacus TaxID=1643323 RepID=A0A5D8ZAZ7_9GAMM|nr:Trm112 family protein [Lysobacter lacus]TZF91817.1 Trm112 family protein [Lysobacter lacus]